MPTNNFTGVNGNANTPSNWSLGHILLATEDGTQTQAITSGTVTGKTFTASNVIGTATIFNVTNGFFATGNVQSVTINGNASGDATWDAVTINGNFTCLAGSINTDGIVVNGNTVLGATCVANSINNTALTTGVCFFNGGFQADFSDLFTVTGNTLYNATGAKLAGISAAVIPFPL